MMKYIFSFLFFTFLSFFAFADKVTFYTGVTLGTNLENPMVNYDSFIPLSWIRSGGICTVASIKKTDSSVWCMTLVVESSAQSRTDEPVYIEYYLSIGEVIYMRRIAEPMKTCKMKVVSVNWNKAVFEIID